MNPENIQSIKLTILSCLLLFHFDDGEAFPSKGLKQPKNNSSCDCDKLIFAHVIFRHGDRNIIGPCPNDPYQDEQTHWPGGFGQLTNEGKRQEYKLGQYLRKRYGQIIGNNYSPDTLYVRSTDFDRTIMSALTNLAGLYPPNGDDIWNEDIPWIPIPVHTIPAEDDYVLHSPHGCAKYDTLFEKYLKESAEVRDTYIQNAYLFTYWSKMCGRDVSTIQDASYLYSGLFVENLHNKKLSQWAQEAIRPNGTLENISELYFKMAAATPQLARFQSGFLLKEILDRFTKKIDSTLQPNKLWLYSAHDLTISYMLQSLGLFKPHLPDYASSLHFELFRTEDGEHYFQLFYRNAGEETTLNIPKCGERCTLDTFYAEHSEIILSNYAEECRLD